MGKAIDITGQKFGRLMAVRFIETRNKHQYWFFKCNCGKEVIICKINVIRGLSKSCGCLSKELARKRVTTHGMRKTMFYRIWTGINTRCSNPNDKTYNQYGAKGIRNLWKSFEEFKNDVYKSYLKHCKEFGIKNTTIDRIDNDGNYCKENCRWATHKEQNRNKRNNRILTFHGHSGCLAEWAENYGITYAMLWLRINRYHWSTEQALTTPIKFSKN